MDSLSEIDGGKPKSFSIINHMGLKLAIYASGYTILYCRENCTNLGSTDNMMCRTHKLGKESYNKCRASNCDKRPCFGYEGTNTLYCSQHKLSNMIDLRHVLCEYPDCTTRPSYGLERGKPRFCTNHKSDNMINLISKKCENPDCITSASYGLEGKSHRFCAKHKLLGIEDEKDAT